MGKYSDGKTAGRSKSVPFIKGESSSDRHWRRLYAAKDRKDGFSLWCRNHGIILKISSDDQHWTIKIKDKVAEWWPSSAKLVFDRKYKKGIHCHDADQVMQQVSKRWQLKKVSKESNNA